MISCLYPFQELADGAVVLEHSVANGDDENTMRNLEDGVSWRGWGHHGAVELGEVVGLVLLRVYRAGLEIPGFDPHCERAKPISDL